MSQHIVENTLILLSLIALGALCLAAGFYALRKRMQQIIDYAEKTCCGVTSDRAPRVRFFLFYPLLVQLAKCRRRILRLQRRNRDLRGAVQTARESLIVREHFVQNVNAELSHPIYSIGHLSEAMLKHYRGELDIGLSEELLEKMIAKISEASKQLQMQMPQSLNVEQIDVRSVVEDCIKATQLRSLIIHNIRIKALFENDIPLFRTDLMRFKQTIVGLLHRALEFSDRDGQITITVRYKEQQPCGELVLEVKDNGLGLALEDRQRISSKHKTATIQPYNHIDIDFPYIVKLVDFLNGVCSIDAVWGEGTTVVARFRPIDQDPMPEKTEVNYTNVVSLTNHRK